MSRISESGNKDGLTNKVDARTVQSIYDAFKKDPKVLNRYYCKHDGCGKIFTVELGGNGLNYEQRLFIILADHIKRAHTPPEEKRA